MAKEPEDKPGNSSADGEKPSPENTPPKDDSPAPVEEGSEQEELPLEDVPEEVEPAEAEILEEAESTEQDEPTEEDEPVHDDQAQDTDVHPGEHGEDPHLAGELDSGHEDPYHDEYHHEDEAFQHDDHHEYHDDHDEYGHESHGAGATGGHGDYDDDDDEEGTEEFGGPIKPFLDHLEDFRWVVMKCVVAVIVGMIVALIGSPYIIKFLKIPLNWAQTLPQYHESSPDKRTIPVRLGDSMVFNIKESDLAKVVKEEELRGAATNLSRITSVTLKPRNPRADGNGTRFALSLHLDTNSTNHEDQWEVQLKAYGPLKTFIIALSIGIYGGLTISMPFLIYFVGQFVLPALRIKEKKWLFKLSSFGSILFFIGATFAYCLVVVAALYASVAFAGTLGLGADEWQAEEYISFVCKFIVGMGLAFQMPMVILFLVKVGILDYKKLAKYRMYAMVANIIVAAVITPTGDPVTLCLVAVPLQLLYELSAFIAWIWYKRDLKAAAEEEDEDDD